MNYYSEQDIREIVRSVLAGCGKTDPSAAPAGGGGAPIPLEASARHVHLTPQAVEALFGPGHKLTRKRDLSQPGEFLAEERVRVVAARGELSNVAVLGPGRKAVQVEISLTDARALGVTPPVNLSGDLTGAADAVLIGPCGIWEARGAVIAARNHIHMTPDQARSYGVADGDKVRVRVESIRPMTFDQVVVRVSPKFDLAMHVDFDEANACALTKEAKAYLVGK